MLDLHALLTAVEDVEGQLRFKSDLPLEEEVPVPLILKHQEIQGWTNREIRPHHETQPVRRRVAESRVDRRVVVKVHKEEISILSHFIFQPVAERN